MAELDLFSQLENFAQESLAALEAAADESGLQQWKTARLGKTSVVQQVFSKIHEIETEHPWLAGRQIQGVADPAIWDAETGESFAETAAKHQVFFAKGDNKRIAGWMQMHYRMSFDENGYPMLYVFDNCRAFIRTIPLLQFDEHKVEDLDTDGEDHVADECRYFCMTRPIAPRPIVQKDGFMESPLHQVFDINRGDIPKRTPHMRTEIIK